MRSEIIEWAPFILAPGVSEADLFRAADDIQTEFLERQPGFIRRDLLKGADGQWVDMLRWETAAAVDAAMAAAAASPICHRYFQLMAGVDHDQPGGGVSLYSRVRAYGRS